MDSHFDGYGNNKNAQGMHTSNVSRAKMFTCITGISKEANCQSTILGIKGAMPFIKLNCRLGDRDSFRLVLGLSSNLDNSTIIQ